MQSQGLRCSSLGTVLPLGFGKNLSSSRVCLCVCVVVAGGQGQQLALESSRIESQILLLSFHKPCLSNLQNGEVIPTSSSC